MYDGSKGYVCHRVERKLFHDLQADRQDSMVTIEIKSKGQRFTINGGRIVDGDMHYASIVRVLAEEIEGTPPDDVHDYHIAQEVVVLHGGRIVEHNDTGFDTE